MAENVSREILAALEDLLTRLEDGTMDSTEAAALSNRTKEKHLEYWEGEELEPEFDLLISMTTVARVPSGMLGNFLKSIRKDLETVRRSK